MATNFPTSLDTLTNPAAGNPLNSPSHSAQHISENDAIEALEAKVGIDGSAVTTSHDYKLSEVTSTDKAVGKTATQTLTNKTLTSPTINLGTNATGDTYYRDSGGAFQRLPIGTSGQVYSVAVSGIPSWISNPAASDASTTVKGVVEIATDAEMNAGTATGATGAVLAIAASSAGAVGANKLVWFTSATKYPAADGSLITNIANPITYKTGVFSQNINSSTTKTIAHGLGKAPKIVRITAIGQAGTVTPIVIRSHGAYNGTTNNCVASWFDLNGSTNGVLEDSTYAIHLSYGTSTTSGTGIFMGGAITFDATNITITYTATGSNTSMTAEYIWEAEA